MSDEDREKIEEIMAGMICPYNLKCTENGSEHLPKTRNVGLSERKQLLCEEDRETSKTCKFADAFGGGVQPYGCFCTCPLQLYLSEKLKKLDMG